MEEGASAIKIRRVGRGNEEDASGDTSGDANEDAELEFVAGSGSVGVSKRLPGCKSKTNSDKGGKGYTWVGDALKAENGRRYYAKLRTPAGDEVLVGSAICVYAPRGLPAFLAQVVAMWENESDNLKQYRCRWFFRPNQALQASALQEACKLQHPREVFLSDEFDTNYVNTIESRTIVMHGDLLPPAFDLDSLRVGGHFFYRSKYERQTRTFIPVKPPSKPSSSSIARGRGGGAVASAASKVLSGGKGYKEAIDDMQEVLVLQEDINILLRCENRGAFDTETGRELVLRNAA